MKKDDIDITRRQVLAGLGTVGVASAGAGLGTGALFSDEESLDGNSLTAGELDLKLDYRSTYTTDDNVSFESMTEAVDEEGNPVPHPDDAIPGTEPTKYVLDQRPKLRYSEDGENYDASQVYSEGDWGDAVRTIGCDGTVERLDGETQSAELVDGMSQRVFDLDDIKPGDEGEMTVSLHHCGNPAYLWMGASDQSENLEGGPENTVVEPEDVEGFEDDDSDGELDDYLWVEAWYDNNCNNVKDAEVDEADIVLAIDVSGSMLYPNRGGDVSGSPSGSGDLRDADFDGSYTSKIDLVEDAVKSFVDEVDDEIENANIGVIFYGTTSEVNGDDPGGDNPNGTDFDTGGGERDGTRVATAGGSPGDCFVDSSTLDSSSTIDDLREEIADSEAFETGTERKGTHISRGVELGRECLENDGTADDQFLVVLCDGGDDEDPSIGGTAVDEANAARSAGIDVFGIAVGDAADDALVQDIANDPDESYFFDIGDEDLGDEVISGAFEQIQTEIGAGTEYCFYQGSMAGFVDELSGGRPFDPTAETDFVIPDRDEATCLSPGLYCLAFRWVFPSSTAELHTLPSSDSDFETLADELADKGLPTTGRAINVTQTDQFALGLRFGAVQCRNNEANDTNPLAESPEEELPT